MTRDRIKVAVGIIIAAIAIFGFFVTKAEFKGFQSEMRAEFKVVHAKLDAMNAKLDEAREERKEYVFL